MAKVYIVTSGSYSDYGINRVFLDRGKAEKYAKTVRDVNDIETYETSDDAEYQEYAEIDVEYCINPKWSWQKEFAVSFEHANTLDREKREISAYNADDDAIWLVRTAPVNADTYVLERKYRRVCEDLYAQIRSLIDIERWTPDMVSEWLADKARYDDVMKTEGVAE